MINIMIMIKIMMMINIMIMIDIMRMILETNPLIIVLRDGLEYCWCSSRDLCNSNPAIVDHANHLLFVFIAVLSVRLTK